MLAFILVCCSVLFGIFRKGKRMTGKRCEEFFGNLTVDETGLLREILLSVTDGAEDADAGIFYRMADNGTATALYIRLVGGKESGCLRVGTDTIHVAKYPFKGEVTLVCHEAVMQEAETARIDVRLKDLPEISRINFYPADTVEESADNTLQRGILNDVELNER